MSGRSPAPVNFDSYYSSSGGASFRCQARLRKNREQDVPGPLIKRECLNGSALQNDSEQRRHFSLHSRLKEILDGF
jgi:hypothetical protein